MHVHTKRLRVPAIRTIGLRKPVNPKPSPGLRVFRAMSKVSRQAIRAYVDGLLGPH
jgi:hypothetical protein